MNVVTLAVDNMSLPPPMIPANCDLRSLPSMLLERDRLFNSDLWNLATGDEFKAALALWLRSMDQVPAGSLPTDERLLARLAGCALGDWRTLSEMALHGWVKCSDGRLYHSVVAEKVLIAWVERIGFRKRSAQANAKRYKKDFDPAPFKAEIEAVVELLRTLSPVEAAKFDRMVALLQGDKDPPTRSQDGSVTECTRSVLSSEIELEIEYELEETCTGEPEGVASAAPTPPKSPGQGRKVRLPPDWQPGEKLETYAADHGFTPSTLAILLDDFRDHYVGTGAAYVDWSRAFQRWVRQDAPLAKALKGKFAKAKPQKREQVW